MGVTSLSTGFVLSGTVKGDIYNITKFGKAVQKPEAETTLENLSNLIPQALKLEEKTTLNGTLDEHSLGEPRFLQVSDGAWSVVKSIGKPIGDLLSFFSGSESADAPTENLEERHEEVLKKKRDFDKRRSKKRRRWRIRYFHELPPANVLHRPRRPWRGRPNSYLVNDDEMLPSSSDQDIVRSTVKAIPLRMRPESNKVAKNFMTTQEYDWHKKWANLNYLEYIRPKPELIEDNGSLEYIDYEEVGYLDEDRKNCDEYEICHDETIVEVNGPSGNSTDLLVQFVPVFPESTKPLPYYKSILLKKDKDAPKIDEGLDSIGLGSDLVQEQTRRRRPPPVDFQTAETKLQFNAERPRPRRRRPVRIQSYRRNQRPSYAAPQPYRHPAPRPIIIKHYADRRVGLSAVGPGVLAALPLVLLSGLAIGFLGSNFLNITNTATTTGSTSGANSGTINLENQLNIGGPNVTNFILNNNTNNAGNTNTDNDTINNSDTARKASDSSWLGYITDVFRSLIDILGSSKETFPSDLVRSAHLVSFPEVVSSMTNLGRRMSCSSKSAKPCQDWAICEQIQGNNNMYGTNLLIRAGEYLLLGFAWWDGLEPPPLANVTRLVIIANREECFQSFSACNETEMAECFNII